MKAVVYTEYGPPEVLHLEAVEKPAPKARELLVRVDAAGVNTGDLWARNFRAIRPGAFSMALPLWFFSRLYFGLFKPRLRVLGSQFAGEVAAVGQDVKRFQVGEPVFGYVGQQMGAYAEYLCVPEDGVVATRPASLTPQQAAAVPYGALMALNLLRKVGLQPGQRILIVGASGAIGSAAVQLAKHHFGAEVTGVCSTAKLEFVRSLGAERVIDYTREDFSEGEGRYDVVFDVLRKSSFARARRVLTPEGRYLLASFKLPQLLQMLWTSLVGGQRVVCALAMEKPEDLVTLRELVEAGSLRAVIDSSHPLEQAAEAHRRLESGANVGSVVIGAG